MMRITPALLLATALTVNACTYSGKSQTHVPLLRQPEAHAIQEGLDGTIRSNSRSIREVLQKREEKQTPWLRFVVIGDTLSDHNLAYREMLAKISRLSPAPEFIVNLGDFIANNLASYSYYLDTIRNYPHPIIHVMGNHESDGGGRRITRAIFGEPDFFFDYGDVRFILMSSDIQGMTGRRLDWLEDKLKADRPSKKIFLSHEFPVEPFKELFPGVYSIFVRSWKNEAGLLGLLERYHVRLAFFGHLHRHYQKIHQETVMVITGGGGQRNQLEPRARQPLSTKRNHFTLIDMIAADGEPPQGVITCVTRSGEPLFMSSFYQGMPDLDSGGSDGKSSRPRMSLVPYDPSDSSLAHPPYLGALYEAYVKKGPKGR